MENNSFNKAVYTGINDVSINKNKNTLNSIEQYFKKNNKTLDYEKLALYLLGVLKDRYIKMYKVERAIKSSTDLEKLKDVVINNSLTDVLNEFDSCVYNTQVTSKIEQYYESIRNGESKPGFRHDVPTIDVVILRDQGLTYEEIAYELGISRSTVINRLKKYNKQLNKGGEHND